MPIDTPRRTPYNQGMLFRFPCVGLLIFLLIPSTTALSETGTPVPSPTVTSVSEQSSESVPSKAMEEIAAETRREKSQSQITTSGSGVSAKIVKAIEVRGYKTIGLNTILAKIKTRVGDEYRPSVISDDIKRLRSLGYFDDVTVTHEDFEGGFRVIFYVEEKPIVEKITFSRLRAMKPAALLRKMATKPGRFLDKKDLWEDKRLIRDLYAQKGFTATEIQVEQPRDELTNKVSLHFIIREGQRIRIRRIFIEGNDNFRDKKILRVMKARAKTWFNSGFLKEDVLKQDMKRIVSFYEKEGYIDARARFEVEPVDDNWVNVRVTVQEGQQYFVEKITVEGNTVFSDDEILSAMTHIREGSVFSRDKLSIDLSSIRLKYMDRGYIFVSVKDSTSLNPDTGKVEIRLDIREGEVAYIHRIKIQGNTRTRDTVVRRELRMYPGERFDGEKIRRSQERLRNLGFFEEINFDTADTDVPNKKDLIVQVKEAKTGTFSFGGGFSTVDQLVGFIEIEQRNFDFTNWPTFTGGGQNLVLRAETGSTRSNRRLSFTEPWLFDYPVSFGFDAFQLNRDKERDVGFAYDEERVGGNIRFGRQFGEYVSGNINYSREKITIDNFDSNVSADLLAEEGENTVSTFTISLARDTRDSVFNPTRGLLVRGTADIAGGPLGGDKDFYRFVTRNSYDIPLSFDSVLEFRLRTGVANAYDNSTKVPIFERFFAGGARTIRGYDERKVGPLDATTNDPIGGEALLVANIEYVIPVIKFIKAAAFFDTGNVWSDMEDFGSGDFKSGAGVGLRVKTPIGPISLDYGYPLNDEPGETDRSGKFYFSVSRGF